MPGGFAARVARAPVRWAGYGVGGLALAVSAAFGGFAPLAHPEAQVKVGEVFQGEPWNVKVVSVRLVGDLSPAANLETKGDHWVAVIAEITVTDTESRNDIRDAVLLRGVKGLVVDDISKDVRAADMLITRDATRVDYLNPGLTEKVAFLWEQAADAELPTSAEVQIFGETHRESSLSGNMGWFDRKVVATVTAAVEDKRNG